jgi:hypothetical protein
LEIVVVDPNPVANINQQYLAADMAGAGLRLWIGPSPTGTPGGPVQWASQDTFTWDAVNKKFTGSIRFDVATVDAAIGVSTFAQGTIEFTITGAARQTLYQGSTQINAVGDESTTSPPGPVDQYLTKAECLALFAKYINDAGKTIQFVSQDGTATRELGVGNDKSSIDNLS